ncbi:MAG: dephospho-CoA kinase [Armatimonadetes bacterium]|nr:dephospho-CoA kinase [Armatimonadota bacterium]
MSTAASWKRTTKSRSWFQLQSTGAALSNRPFLSSPLVAQPTLHWSPLVVVGVTGGIASGKSTVCRMLAELGAAPLNADDVGRAVVQPGEPALAELIAAFGPEFLAPDGTLRRRELGARVFSERAALRCLNRITHPRIEAGLRRRLETWARCPPTSGVVVLEAAVLIEAGWHRLVDRVIVVSAQPSTQVARLIAGLGLSSAEAEARIQAQLSASARIRHADYVLVGELPLTDLRLQVGRIWQQIRDLGPGG